jgi:hypothetical protein
MTNPTPQPDRIEILTEQIGRLTEAVTIGFQDCRTDAEDIKTVLTDGFADLKATIERQATVAERQAETARLQAESVARLIDRLG